MSEMIESQLSGIFFGSITFVVRECIHNSAEGASFIFFLMLMFQNIHQLMDLAWKASQEPGLAEVHKGY